MSYPSMHNNSIPRGSYVPEYDSNPSYKMPASSTVPPNYPQYPQSNQPMYSPMQPPQNSNTSANQQVAIFSIPSDGTNSLYIDGVPNDTN